MESGKEVASLDYQSRHSKQLFELAKLQFPRFNVCVTIVTFWKDDLGGGGGSAVRTIIIS